MQSVPVTLAIAGLALAATRVDASAAVSPSLAITGSDRVIDGDLGPFQPTWNVRNPESDQMLPTLTSFGEAFGHALVRTMNCCGELVSETPQNLGSGPCSFEVPPSGLLEVILAPKD